MYLIVIEIWILTEIFLNQIFQFKFQFQLQYTNIYTFSACPPNIPQSTTGWQSVDTLTASSRLMNISTSTLKFKNLRKMISEYQM